MRVLNSSELFWISGGSEETRAAGQEAGKKAGEAVGKMVVNSIEFAAAVVTIGIALVALGAIGASS